MIGTVVNSARGVVAGFPVGGIDRDAVTDLVLTRLGACRSAWNSADIRGEVEKIIATTGVITIGAVRRELAEDLTTRTIEKCTRLLDRDDVPGHVRALTSTRVLQVEADLTNRFAARAHTAIRAPSMPPEWVEMIARRRGLDGAQQRVAATLAGTRSLVVVEGAAGSGKTTTLAAAQHLLVLQDRQLLVVTPTLKAAQVAATELGATAFTAAWLIHQHGYRWDTDGHRTRTPTGPCTDATDPAHQSAHARLRPGDVLLIDEAGMLDQDTAHALLTIADETGACIALVGDRHQLPAVGRGGVLDLAARHTTPGTHLTLESVHRFTDPEYAKLSLLMRTGEQPGHVFDTLLRRGEIVIHATDVERQATLAALSTGVAGANGSSIGGLVIADTQEQVAALNATIRDRRLTTGEVAPAALTTRAGELLGVGDQVTTRRNDPDLGVANRDRWHVAATGPNGTLTIEGRPGIRTLPPAYVAEHVQLAYATTVYGAQGDTVEAAHLLIGDTTGAAAAYVGMTRGKNHNTAHLVSETTSEARAHWIKVFSRDRADLGPAHAAHAATQDIDRYGPHVVPARRQTQPTPLRSHDSIPTRSSQPDRAPGIGY